MTYLKWLEWAYCEGTIRGIYSDYTLNMISRLKVSKKTIKYLMEIKIWEN